MAILTGKGLKRHQNREPLLSAGLTVINHHYSTLDLDFMFQILLNKHSKQTGEDIRVIFKRLVDSMQHTRESHQRKQGDAG